MELRRVQKERLREQEAMWLVVQQRCIEFFGRVGAGTDDARYLSDVNHHIRERRAVRGISCLEAFGVGKLL